MGQLNDLLDGIRNLPCVREARGVAKALVFALPDAGEPIDLPPPALAPSPRGRSLDSPEQSA